MDKQQKLLACKSFAAVEDFIFSLSDAEFAHFAMREGWDAVSLDGSTQPSPDELTCDDAGLLAYDNKICLLANLYADDTQLFYVVRNHDGMFATHKEAVEVANKN